jgi:probable phosphoglycerate mutase
MIRLNIIENEGMRMTTIGFVRHGVTDWNQQFRAQGQKDVPLNEEGIRQAEQLGVRLAEEDWDYIFTSDLSRARETAEIIAAAMGIKVHGYDPRLREKTHGQLDGTTEAEREVRWGTGWREIDHGEESTESVLQRSRHFMQDIATDYSAKKILVVSHGALIRITLAELLNDAKIQMLHNTSVSILQRQGEGWDCKLYNCIKHLAAV